MLILLQILFLGCKKQDSDQELILRAEHLLQSRPDSSNFLLSRISNPDDLTDSSFAYWCMLSCKVADKLFEDMPYLYRLNRAYSWYKKNGTLNDSALMGYYLGRAYVEDKELDKAMKEYLGAINLAEKCNDIELLGYIYSYMGDLYSFKDMLKIACEKYNKGAYYFNASNNNRSYALALRDVGRMWAFQDSLSLALSFLLKADSIAISLDDPYVESSISNSLGNVYSMLGYMDLAETCLLKALECDSQSMTPTYLALSNLCIENEQLLKAQSYLDISKRMPQNEFTSARIFYQQYLIEKGNGFFKQALDNLEQYELIADSITIMQNEQDIIKVDRKYNQIKLLNENNELKLNKQRNIIFIVFLSAILFFVLFLYQIKIKYKNRKIYEQQAILDKNEIEILKLLTNLNNKKNELNNLKNEFVSNQKQIYIQSSLQEKKYLLLQKEIYQINDMLMKLREERFKSLPITRKFISLSKKIIAGATRSPLLDKDWDELKNEVDKIYITIDELLRRKDFGLTIADVRYCYLSLFNFTTNEESVLLHINPTSVIKRRFRVRTKLGIIRNSMTICDYLLKS